MLMPRPHIAQMSAYALAQIDVSAAKPVLSLSQNESLRPPSPKALAAARSALANGALYPDPNWRDLREELSILHEVPVENILCGNGSLDLISNIAFAYSGPGRSVLTSEHAYPFFRTAAQISGARFDTVAEVDLMVSVDALLEAVRADTGILFVANPGNPTGTRLSKSELLRLRASLRSDILLVIDEAYGEFSDHQNPPVWDMVDGDNCVVLRTFSKAYSLAGFRVGWGVFPSEVAVEIRKIMNPNALTSVSQAVAHASVRDQPYMRETCRRTTDLREKWAIALNKAGCVTLPSHTNFLLLEFESTAQAESVDDGLQKQGVFLRRQQAAGLPHCLRMTMGPDDQMARAVAQITRCKEEFPT